MNMQKTFEIKTGYLVRQIDAITKGLQVIRDELAKIPDMYCHDDGNELEHVRYESQFEIKHCPRCGDMVAIPINMQSGE